MRDPSSGEIDGRSFCSDLEGKGAQLHRSVCSMFCDQQRYDNPICMIPAPVISVVVFLAFAQLGILVDRMT